MDEQLFHTAVHMAGGVIGRMQADDMGKATPCSEWNVQTLANHMLNELAWVAPLLQGKTIADVGTALDGNLVGDDAKAAWMKYAKEAIEVASTTPPETTTHLSYGDVPAGQYVNEVGADLIVHTWDLAKALGVEFHFDDATAQAVIDAMARIMPSAREGGLIAPAVDTPANASGEQKVIGLFGRQYNWVG